MANSIAQFFVNFRARHPEANRPVTDYLAPLILLPAQLGGNNIGVVLGGVFPADVLITGSICLLIAVTAKVAYRGYKLHKTEQAAREEHSEPLNQAEAGHSHETLGQDESKWDKLQVPHSDEEVNNRASAYLKKRSSPDLYSVAILLLLWGIFSVVYVLLKEAQTCSTDYWVALASLYPILIVFTGIGVWYILRDQKEMHELIKLGAIKKIEFDVQWSMGVIVKYGLLSVAVGFVGGILGLGGAEFMAPLMLEMGMASNAAAATAAYMNLFTSASNLVHYSQIPGVLPPHYTVWFCITAFLAGICGRSISSRVAASGRQSVIIFALATVLGVSAILLGWRAADSKSDWTFHFDSFC